MSAFGGKADIAAKVFLLKQKHIVQCGDYVRCQTVTQFVTLRIDSFGRSATNIDITDQGCLQASVAERPIALPPGSVGSASCHSRIISIRQNRQ
jgi:hypothetical protein